MSLSLSYSGSTPIENTDKLRNWDDNNDGTKKPGDDRQDDQDEDVTVTEQTANDQTSNDEKNYRWFRLKGTAFKEDGEQDWWFASTAIPLLAATIGPLANVLSIAALVTSWRVSLVPPSGSTAPADLLPDLSGVPFADPRWCYWLNVVSLILGFIGITVSMEIHVPPNRPTETYSQGFWYAVIAAVLYFICSMLLMFNMLGCFLGHYKEHFALTDDQRNLILQTYLFFVWLAGGAAVFSAFETRWGQMPWSFVDGLYFCDVTILTVGFGDLTPTDNVGRGIVFPYSVGGIIMLGLVISSISRFTGELGQENVVKGHVERARVRTVGRSVTDSFELEERAGVHIERPHRHRPPVPTPERRRSSVSTHFNMRERARTLRYADEAVHDVARSSISNPSKPRRQGTLDFNLNLKRVNPVPRVRKPKLILLREERDRFNAMRQIQKSTTQFKRWAALTMSATSFSILWCVGAVVFWQVERNHQQMSYFEALYFCYVSLLTIGYGDYAPKSNAGRPIFIVWSLIAVPTMTVLISHMGDTVISGFKQGTFTVADWTLLPKKGLWRAFLDKNPWLLNWILRWREEKAAKKRLEEGFQAGLDDQPQPTPTIDELATEQLSDHALAKRLASAIRKTATDLKHDNNDQKRYTYEEWVEFTRLIRFTSKQGREEIDDEEEDGLIEWDWIGEDSPMMTGQSEAEFVLDRLCESMTRYIRLQVRGDKNKKRKDLDHDDYNNIERHDMKAIDEDVEVGLLDPGEKG
ncbi:MAG: hypothetical protein Q9157_002435 [Trypethelium eluteriae]